MPGGKRQERGTMRIEKDGRARRLPEFDFIKGVLVLFMVFYHWLNYFVGPQGEIYVYFASVIHFRHRVFDITCIGV